MKRVFFVPTKGLKAIFKEEGGHHCSREALIELSNELKRISRRVIRKAIVIAAHSKRARVRKEDILFITSSIETD